MVSCPILKNGEQLLVVNWLPPNAYSDDADYSSVAWEARLEAHESRLAAK